MGLPESLRALFKHSFAQRTDDMVTVPNTQARIGFTQVCLREPWYDLPMEVRCMIRKRADDRFEYCKRCDQLVKITETLKEVHYCPESVLVDLTEEEMLMYIHDAYEHKYAKLPSYSLSPVARAILAGEKLDLDYASLYPSIMRTQTLTQSAHHSLPLRPLWQGALLLMPIVLWPVVGTTIVGDSARGNGGDKRIK